MSQIKSHVSFEVKKSGTQDFKLDITSDNQETNYIIQAGAEARKKIVRKIFSTDPSIVRQLERTGSFRWNIEVDGIRVKTRRLPLLLPFLFYPIYLDEKLYNYQKEGVAWLLASKQRLLADDMGLGKTVQVLIALQKKIFHEHNSINLLLAPITLINNWKNEAEVWAPNLKIEIISAETLKDENRLARLITTNNLVMCPYSLTNSLKSKLSKLHIKFDLLICDEAHKLRKKNSQVNRTIRQFNTTSRWLITGTPMERDEDDIISILKILFPEKTFSKGDSSSILLKANLKSSTLRREKVDVLPDLPEVRKNIHEVELTEEERSFYNQIKRKILSLSPDKRISLITSLCIATCKSVNTTNSKVKKALEILEKCLQRDEKVIIFSNFNEVLRDCQNILLRKGIGCLLFTGELNKEERAKVLRSFKTQTKNPVLLLNSRVGGEGLTLTEANNVIFLNEWWNPSSNRQAEDRVNRIGQTKTINVHVIRALNSLDFNVSKIIKSKTTLEKSFLKELVKSLGESHE